MFKNNKEKQTNERKTFKEFVSDNVRGFKRVLLCFFFIFSKGDGMFG